MGKNYFQILLILFSLSSIFSIYKSDDETEISRTSRWKCGRSKTSLLETSYGGTPSNAGRNDLRIVNGYNVKEGEIPWQVSINLFKLNDYRHWCGGVIIAESWVLSAAHCFYNENAKNFRIIAGEFSIKHESGREQQSDVEKLFLHENYDDTTKQDDLALIKLKSPFKLNSFVAPICLPKKYEKFSGTVTASGWGATDEGQSNEDLLLGVNIEILDAFCRSEESYGDRIKPGMMCAGRKDGKSDTCQGDSGGPLIKLNSRRSILVGITSWGSGCGRKGKPGVYTEVSQYIDWIESKMGSKAFKSEPLKDTVVFKDDSLRKAKLWWDEDNVDRSGKCGVHAPKINGKTPICNPRSNKPCCSVYGLCGSSRRHCNCFGCINFRTLLRKYINTRRKNN